mmetsp:Transcript_18105/g.22825  ORF Transcript_18105/g.22825 Transcript_18105/m.22825 type:complete len:130 (-) Transcript_18105:431-820(-)
MLSVVMVRSQSAKKKIQSKQLNMNLNSPSNVSRRTFLTLSFTGVLGITPMTSDPAFALGRRGRKATYGSQEEEESPDSEEAYPSKEDGKNNASNNVSKQQEEEEDPFADRKKKKIKKKPRYCEVNQCGY